MALSVWQRNVVTESGDVIPDAEIEVFDAGEASKPDLFSDPAGTTAITNPFNADTSGFARFYVAGGRYDIAVNGVVTWEGVNLELISDHAAETGGIHGIPANERAIHSEELRAAVSTATTTAEAVSMTGKGAIVESGSTPDGSYVRWENGEQVSFYEGVAVYDSADRLIDTWAYPAGFISEPPSASLTQFTTTNGVTPAPEDRTVGRGGASATSMGIRIMRVTGTADFQSGDELRYFVSAWGFYK